MKRKFEDLGRVVATKSVWNTVNYYIEFQEFMFSCLERYSRCDWGEMDAEDINSNNYAVRNGERILASYNFPDNAVFTHDDGRLWIITEWDRSVTTILFPSDY